MSSYRPRSNLSRVHPKPKNRSPHSPNPPLPLRIRNATTRNFGTQTHVTQGAKTTPYPTGKLKLTCGSTRRPNPRSARQIRNSTTRNFAIQYPQRAPATTYPHAKFFLDRDSCYPSAQSDQVIQKVSALAIKDQVLDRISAGRSRSRLPKEKWRIGNSVVHVRYRSSPKSKSVFSYNINPNTLTADFEIWICGEADSYYLFPIAVMKSIYEDPDAYVDKTHPEIRVAEVDMATHRLLFGRGGKELDCATHFRAVLKDYD